MYRHDYPNISIIRIFVVMIEIIRKILSIAMAFLLLASTTSWTVGKHYCMGHLMDVSFFAHAEDCGMDMMVSDEDISPMEGQDSCCNDEIIVVDGQNDLKISFNDIKIDQHEFLVAFTYSYFSLFEIRSERSVLSEYYPPPILVKDIQLLDKVFLI